MAIICIIISWLKNAKNVAQAAAIIPKIGTNVIFIAILIKAAGILTRGTKRVLFFNIKKLSGMIYKPFHKYATTIIGTMSAAEWNDSFVKT